MREQAKFGETFKIQLTDSKGKIKEQRTKFTKVKLEEKSKKVNAK